MPNWCQNRIVIPKEKFKDFKRKFMSDRLAKPNDNGVRYRFDLNRVLRQPSKEDCFNWRSVNWNTRYNALHTAVVFQNDVAEIDFDTAWNPVGEKVLFEISKRLKCDVKHLYYESGCDIYGLDFYSFNEDDCSDNVEKSKTEKGEELYRTVLEEFYGDSDYANEELERLMGA